MNIIKSINLSDEGFSDGFKYSLIKMACRDPASITPVEVCHTFKVPKALKPPPSTALEKPQYPKAKAPSAKTKKDKGEKGKKGKKDKKKKSKSVVSEADDEVTGEKETKTGKGKKKKGRKSGKQPKLPEENRTRDNVDKGKLPSVAGATLSPEQCTEIETKATYILPLADGVDNSFFEKIFNLKSKAAEHDKKVGKPKKDKKEKEKGKRDKSKKKKGK